MATSDKNITDYSQIASLAGDDELFVFDKSEYAVEGYEGNWTTPTQLTAWSFANSSTYEPKFKGIELEGTTLSSIQSIGKDLWIDTTGNSTTKINTAFGSGDVEIGVSSYVVDIKTTLKHTGSSIGFNNTTPVAQSSAIADATDAASVILRLNDLLAYLETRGDIAT